MSRWVEIMVIVLIALGALAVGAVAALYFIGPTRIAGGEVRKYFLIFNAPPCTMTTEADAAYKGAAAAPKAAAAAAQGAATDEPSYNKGRDAAAEVPVLWIPRPRSA